MEILTVCFEGYNSDDIVLTVSFPERWDTDA